MQKVNEFEFLSGMDNHFEQVYDNVPIQNSGENDMVPLSFKMYKVMVHDLHEILGGDSFDKELDIIQQLENCTEPIF